MPCSAAAVRLHVSGWFAEITDRLRRLAVNRADARGVADRTRDGRSNERREGVQDHVVLVGDAVLVKRFLRYSGHE